MGIYFDALTEEQKKLVCKHLDLVIEANKSINLTRIDSTEDGMLLHVEDSLSGLPEIKEAPEGMYGDLGSGAGFPGIPLAIASGRMTMLVDSRKRKMDVVAEIISKLGLSTQISTYAGRAELLVRSKPESFSVLTARALSKLSVLMELASPLLVHGGRLVCYKAHVDKDELEHALELQKMLGMKLCSDRSFRLEDYDRRIIVFEKISNPEIKLPRLEGQAQKNPL